MAQKKLFIPSGMHFGVIDMPRNENENQKFLINLHDNKPDRIVEYTAYDTWVQTVGQKMLDLHIELLGRAINANSKELFETS